jgi:DNA-binding IclR family transcriptional regulator
MPLVGDESKGLWALGPAAGPTARALVSAVAPELNLPDLRTGETFSLSSLKGQKVALITWASW